MQEARTNHHEGPVRIIIAGPRHKNKEENMDDKRIDLCASYSGGAMQRAGMKLCMRPRQDHSIALKIRVTSILHELGIPANTNGYKYLREGIMIAAEHTGKIKSMTKFLYPMIAQRYDTLPGRVERAMRSSIGKAWDRGNPDVLYQYFGYTVSSEKGKPTNGEFISMIADHLELTQEMQMQRIKEARHG